MATDRFLKGLGLHFKALRLARRLTQEDVGERAGFTAKYVSEIERGLRDIPLSTLRRISEDGMGVSAGDALTGAQDGARTGTRSSPREGAKPLPEPHSRPVDDAARRIGALSPAHRKSVLQILRGILRLAER